MTGFGEARLQDPRWIILVEVRTVNNRHFKLNAKISDAYATLEPLLEQLVRREKVKAGEDCPTEREKLSGRVARRTSA